jgi:predicted RNA-binding protein Jag
MNITVACSGIHVYIIMITTTTTTTTKPAIIGATGTILKSLLQYLTNIPGKHKI